MTSSALEVAKSDFIQAGSAASATSVLALFDYWIQVARTSRLFGDRPEDEENDLALLLQAKAHGAVVEGYPALAVWGRYEAALQAVITPPSLPWGPRAALAPEIESALDSPVLHAWVFIVSNPKNNAQSFQRILVVGRGAGGIWNKVFVALFMTSLRLPRLPQDPVDVFSDGVIQINSPGAQRGIKGIPFSFIGTGGASRANQTATVEAELRRVVGYLEKLQTETGLIRVHKIERAKDDLLVDLLRTKAAAVQSQEAKVWCPGASAPEWTDLTRYWQNGR